MGDSEAQGTEETLENAFYTVTAEDGDLLSVAQKFGFRNWKTIYWHDQNLELRKKRYRVEMICVGDKIWIPAKNPKRHECETNPEPYDEARRHTFVLPLPTRKLDFVLDAGFGCVYVNRRFEIWLDDQLIGEENRRTDKEGRVKAEIPAVEGVKLVIWPSWDPEADKKDCETRTIKMTAFQPPDTVKGIQQRLELLGLDCGDEEEIGEKTRAALAKAQEEAGLEVTGVAKEDPSDATVKHLVEIFDEAR